MPRRRYALYRRGRCYHHHPFPLGHTGSRSVPCLARPVPCSPATSLCSPWSKNLLTHRLVRDPCSRARNKSKRTTQTSRDSADTFQLLCTSSHTKLVFKDQSVLASPFSHRSAHLLPSLSWSCLLRTHLVPHPSSLHRAAPAVLPQRTGPGPFEPDPPVPPAPAGAARPPAAAWPLCALPLSPQLKASALSTLPTISLPWTPRPRGRLPDTSSTSACQPLASGLSRRPASTRLSRQHLKLTVF